MHELTLEMSDCDKLNIDDQLGNWDLIRISYKTDKHNNCIIKHTLQLNPFVEFEFYFFISISICTPTRCQNQHN